ASPWRSPIYQERFSHPLRRCVDRGCASPRRISQKANSQKSRSLFSKLIEANSRWRDCISLHSKKDCRFLQEEFGFMTLPSFRKIRTPKPTHRAGEPDSSLLLLFGCAQSANQIPIED